MSTTAHEPRRVGPRRADTPSGSKVAPRRNVTEASEPGGLQYDSDELPVLIRLPNLREAVAVEQPPKAHSKRKHRTLERASEGKQGTSKPGSGEVAKKPIPQPARYNKLVLGGIGGGILAIIVLVLLNAGGSTPPAEEDGWANEAAELEPLVQEPEITFATEIAPPPLYPGVPDAAPNAETAQFAGDESIALDMPHTESFEVTTRPALPTETAAVAQKPRTVESWPSDETLGLPASGGATPTSLWPSDSFSQEPGGLEYSPTNSPSQADYRSSMYPPETESFRMGKLNSDRPLATEGDPSSILDGNIEIPDTTSLR